jgi:hypothetical protein
VKRILVIVAALSLVAACGDGTGGAPSSDTPREGGTLTFAVGSDAGCVDPQQVGSNDTIYSLRQIVDSLTDQDPETGKIVPWLADGIDFTINRHETLALVGESGSGKTTTARLVLRQIDATAGSVTFDGEDVTHARGRALRALRRRAQLIYQNPYASLNPRFSIAEIVTEPLRSFGIGIGDRAGWPAPESSSTGCGCRRPCCDADPPSSPAASASTWRSPARWRSRRSWSCATSRCRPSTSRCRHRYCNCSPTCRPTPAWRTCSSPTTSAWCGRSRTGSP